MFVRRKHNRSGTVSIQVIAKVDGKYRVQKSFGSSRDEGVLAALEQKARQWADEHEFGEALFTPAGAAEYDAIMAGIGQDQLRLVGPDLIYGRLFDKIGFGTVRTSDNDIFKSLVVTRLYRPGSKLKKILFGFEMRYILLDFDGVLNTDSYQVYLRTHGKPGWDDYGQLFDPEAVENLKLILDAVPDLRIVVESSWKVNGLDELRLMWKERNLPGELYDVTPDIFNEALLTIDLSDPDNIRKVEGLGKGGEISAWLKRHGGQDCRYVILDDVAEFSGELASHHILISPDLGITREDAMKVISYLK